MVEQEAGIGEGGGAFALWDDGNPAWETEDEDDDVIQQAMWRQDEKENNEQFTNVEKATINFEVETAKTEMVRSITLWVN